MLVDRLRRGRGHGLTVPATPGWDGPGHSPSQSWAHGGFLVWLSSPKRPCQRGRWVQPDQAQSVAWSLLTPDGSSWSASSGRMPGGGRAHSWVLGPSPVGFRVRREGWDSDSFRFYHCGQEHQKPFADRNLSLSPRACPGDRWFGAKCFKVLESQSNPCKTGMIYL